MSKLVTLKNEVFRGSNLGKVRTENWAMSEAALEGVKVLEYCEFIAGPYCGKLLADLGAEVIKIEAPYRGDVARHRGPFWHDEPGADNSGLFFFLNVNKLGITLNPLNPRGRKLFESLVKDVDILIGDKSPGFMQKAGLTYEKLRKLNPRLIQVSVTPFGQTGPYKDYKAYPLNTFQSGGEGYLTPGGSPNLDRSPVTMGKFAGDYICGVSAAGATLVALFYQRLTGQGQRVDISKQEALLGLDLQDLLRWPRHGVLVNRLTRGYRLAGMVPCQDGYVEFAYHRWPEEWLSLLKAIGAEDWAEDDKMKDHNYCIDHAPEIKTRLAELLQNQTKAELYRKARAEKAPLAPCYRVDEVVNSEQMQARGFFADIGHPKWGKVKYPTAAYKYSQTPVRIERLAPSLGEHNHDIYCGRLGLSKFDLVKLREAGVI